MVFGKRDEFQNPSKINSFDDKLGSKTAAEKTAQDEY